MSPNLAIVRSGLLQGSGAGAGWKSVRISIPLDSGLIGQTRYAHFRSYYGWNPVSATLEEVSPRARVIESFPDLPVALADYSQDADVTAELVDAGRGALAKDFDGKAIKGRIVLAGEDAQGNVLYRRGAAS